MLLLLMLLQNKQSEFCAPLTSFDWNEADPKRLGTSSIDTTCTIWDIEVCEGKGRGFGEGSEGFQINYKQRAVWGRERGQTVAG